MKILLSPSEVKRNNLIKSYQRAITSSKELYIGSAFLTNWDIKKRLSPGCKKFLFLVGTDFGLTRKDACANVLKWLPKKFKSDFLAVPSSSAGNFHPKIVIWHGNDNKYHCIIGSSNLTDAAFSSNYEANVEFEISRYEYDQIVQWIENIAVNCQIINDDWLSQYKERKYSGGGRRKSIIQERVIELKLPKGKKYNNALKERRKQQKAFKEIDTKLLSAMKKCAKGSISNSQFWEKLKELWYHHYARIQGSGFQFSAKKANWKQACQSMIRILDSAKTHNEVNLDRVVQYEIDRLASAGNPVRGSWFSEILCHYLPDSYPIVSNPVNEWLKKKNWKAQRGASEGSAYIELSRKLREVIRQNKDGPRNLIELDAVIWTEVNG